MTLDSIMFAHPSGSSAPSTIISTFALIPTVPHFLFHVFNIFLFLFYDLFCTTDDTYYMSRVITTHKRLHSCTTKIKSLANIVNYYKTMEIVANIVNYYKSMEIVRSCNINRKMICNSSKWSANCNPSISMLLSTVISVKRRKNTFTSEQYTHREDCLVAGSINIIHSDSSRYSTDVETLFQVFMT